MMDKQKVAKNIRLHLEKRIAEILECSPAEFPRLKLGTLVHLVFLLRGHAQDLGGFNTSMDAILTLVGNDLTWDIEPKTEEPKPEVIN